MKHSRCIDRAGNAGPWTGRQIFNSMIRSEHRKPAAPFQSVAISIEDPIGPAARELIDALCAEMCERYGRPPSPFSLSEAAVDKSVFIIARRDGEPVACGALRPFDDDSAELKRMYVVPAARRQGFGRLIIAALERHARVLVIKRFFSKLALVSRTRSVFTNRAAMCACPLSGAISEIPPASATESNCPPRVSATASGRKQTGFREDCK